MVIQTFCLQIRLPYRTHLGNRVHHIWNTNILFAHCSDECDMSVNNSKIKELGYATDHLGVYFLLCVGRVAQSVQRLATGWTIRGSNPGGGQIFRTCPDRPWGPPSLLYNAHRVFPGGKERPGRDADPSPPSSAVVMKEQSYTSTPSTGHTACTEPQCLYKGALYLFYLLAV